MNAIILRWVGIGLNHQWGILGKDIWRTACPLRGCVKKYWLTLFVPSGYWPHDNEQCYSHRALLGSRWNFKFLLLIIKFLHWWTNYVDHFSRKGFATSRGMSSGESVHDWGESNQQLPGWILTMPTTWRPSGINRFIRVMCRKGHIIFYAYGRSNRSLILSQLLAIIVSNQRWRLQ